MYDAIVVGARCAGSPVAMLLARRGHRVLLVDRMNFPSDTISTHYLQQAGLLRLRDWGLLDDLVATGVTPIRQMTLSHRDLVISGFAEPVDGIDFSCAPRRFILDKILLDGAAAAGVEVREGVSVRELLRAPDGRVVGIRGQDAAGAAVEERAPIVIGADGRNSFVGGLVGAEFYNVVPAASFIYYSYWSGLDWAFHSRFGDGEQCAAWPTHGGLTLVATMRRRDRFEEFRADVEGSMHQVVRSIVPELADDLAANGVRQERLYGLRYPDNSYRTSHGPGWALVGDAGYHKDPVTGQGIADAFHHAELLAERVHQGLSGQRPMDAALAEYQQVRDADSGTVYFLTTTIGELDFPKELVAVLSALPGNDRARALFFGLLAGVVPAAEFFAPANIDSLLASAA